MRRCARSSPRCAAMETRRCWSTRRRFDGVAADALSELRVPGGELGAAWDAIGAGERAALTEAAARIRGYHERQRQDSWHYLDEDGSTLGQRITPLDRVGVYVPGGKASYPSSVLMNTIPARVAGVAEIVMAVPAPSGELNPLVLAAANLAAVDEVWTIGGAQAIAALAFGAGPIRAVDKIVGPGNRYVAAAKRLVFGVVGIDMLAGPSEIVIVCDGHTPVEWIVMDLFSQAEHDEDARAILISPDTAFLDRVETAIESMLPTLERAEIVARSLAAHGALTRSARSRRGDRARQPPRTRTPGAVGGRCTAPGGRCPPCRGRLPRLPYSRGVRRLLRGPEPRAADRTHRAFLLSARGLRLSETYERDRLLAAWSPAPGGGRIHTRARGIPHRTRALGRAPGLGRGRRLSRPGVVSGHKARRRCRSDSHSTPPTTSASTSTRGPASQIMSTSRPRRGSCAATSTISRSTCAGYSIWAAGWAGCASLCSPAFPGPLHRRRGQRTPVHRTRLGTRLGRHISRPAPIRSPRLPGRAAVSRRHRG